MKSKATTVKQYLAELPPDRRAAIEAVRKVVLKNLDKVYEEGMQYGMIGYYVPHSAFPAGYHCDPKQPLPFVCLASQKNYLSLYMGCVYGDSKLAEKFQADWAKTGKKLDMGKSCIRFKRAEDLALDAIGDAIKRMPAKKWIAVYESSLAQPRLSREEITARTKAAKATKLAAAKSRGGVKKRVAKKSAPKRALAKSPGKSRGKV